MQGAQLYKAPFMDQDVFKNEDFDINEYITGMFSNSSEKDISNAMNLLQKTIILNRSQSKTLIKKHFSKFVECNTVLEKIMKDLKHRSIPSAYIKHQCSNISSKMQKIESFEEEESKENGSNIRTLLQSNYNNFAEFARIYRGIKDKNMYQAEKVTFLNFLMEKIESQGCFVADVTKYFELYFEVEDDNSKSEKFYNTLLVCFKYQLSLIYVVNSDFNLFFNNLLRVALSFFKFMKSEQIKKAGLEDIFRNIQEQLGKYKNSIKVPKEKGTPHRCNCLVLRSTGCNQVTKDGVRSKKPKRQLIMAKIFMRKVAELRLSLSKFLSTAMQSFISGQIEKSKEIWISIIFMELKTIEGHLFYKEMSDMFNSRRDCLVRSTIEYLFFILDKVETCNIKRYELVEVVKSNLQKESYDAIRENVFKGVYLVLGRTQTIEVLKEIQRRLLRTIAEFMVPFCNNDTSCLIIATRIMLRAPNSWKRILLYSKNVFEERKAVHYILKDALNTTKIPLDSTEMNRVKELSLTYGFFLKQPNVQIAGCQGNNTEDT